MESSISLIAKAVVTVGVTLNRWSSQEQGRTILAPRLDLFVELARLRFIGKYKSDVCFLRRTGLYRRKVWESAVVKVSPSPGSR